MKKRPKTGSNAIVFMLIAAFLLTACGKTVEVYYPADFFKEEDLDFMAKEFKKTDGIKKVTVNDDGSITLRVTEEKYAEQVDAMREMAESMYSTVGGEESYFTAVKELEYSDDFSTLTLSIDRSVEMPSAEEESISQIIYIARLYWVYELNPEKTIEVNYKDTDTGEIYNTEYYKPSGESVDTSEEAESVSEPSSR